MKLLLISDLHLQEENDWKKINIILESMIRCVKNKMKDNEEIIVITLGDIIDQSKINAFVEAKILYNQIQNNFENIKFRFVPGNHEVTSNSTSELDEFNKFVKEYSNLGDYTDKCSVQFEDIEGFRILYVDSTLSRDHKSAGKINVEEIKSKISKGKNIICMHYPPCEQDGIDKSIPNTKELIGTRANFIFYGHQHGYVKTPDFLAKDTDIHSIGAFLKYDLSNYEFVLLDISDGGINFAYRYLYVSEEKIVRDLLYPKKNNIFSDNIKVKSPILLEKSVLKRKIHSDDDSDITSVCDYVNKNNLIILNGDAGSGKTFELKLIYEIYKTDDEYYPIWIELKNTNNEKLKEYIGYCKKTIDRKIPLLIFDGLDEMKNEDMNVFLRDIQSAIVGDVEIKVIISERRFLKRTLDGFVNGYLKDIEEQDIKEYLENKGVNVYLFYNELRKSECIELAKKPFYLVELVRIFLSEKSIPNKIDLLPKMIKCRLNYSNKKQNNMLTDNEASIYVDLRKISFFMQTQQKNYLENSYYTDEKILSVYNQNLLKNTGLLTAYDLEDETVWEFEHSIFKEYFVAEYLGKLSFKDIIEVIAKYDKLKPSWLNVVSYLLQMQNDDNLLNWLIQNDKDFICEFEPNKLKIDNRNNVFKEVFNDTVYTKKVHIDRIYDVTKLGRYFQSYETIRFMIDRLKEDKENHAILSILNILVYCNDFYDKEDELRKIIFEKILSDKSDEYIISLYVELLIKIFIGNLDEITNDVFELLHKDKRSYVFGALCKLLNEANVVDDHIEFIIDSIQTNKSLIESSYTNYVISDILKKVKSVNAVSRVILFCRTEKIIYRIMKYIEILKYNCKMAIELYKQGENDILLEIINYFKYLAINFRENECKVLKEIFISTKMLKIIFGRLINDEFNDMEMFYTIKEIMDDSLCESLIEKYFNSDKIDDAFKLYARRLPSDSEIFKKLDDVVLKKEGKRIELKIDGNEEYKKNIQKYFDSLFDKQVFGDLIKELLEYIKYDDITFEQLFDSSNKIYNFSDVPNIREDLQKIRTSLFHSGLNKQRIIDFFEYINWERFFAIELYHMLNDYQNILIDEKQVVFIHNFLNNQFSNIDFENYNKNEEIFIMYLVTIAIKTDFIFEDKKLIEMITFPDVFYFMHNFDILNFVKQKVNDKQKLKNKILKNMKNKKLEPYAAREHMLYCLENNLDDVVDIAVEILKNENEEIEMAKDVAVKYLQKIKGDKFIDNLVSKINDRNSLSILSYNLKTNNTKLIEKLRIENENSDDKKLFLIELIHLNSRYGIEKYFEIAKKENKPIYLGENDIINRRMIREIENISDIKLIDVVAKLVELCYSVNFHDAEDFGLNEAIWIVVRNFVQSDKSITKKTLTELVEQNPEKSKLISACNYYLNIIEEAIIDENDRCWSVEETIRFLNSKRN